MAKSKHEYRFTFIGRVSCLNLPNTTILPPMHGKSLAIELSKHNVYISSSVNDPGPNHILEAIACGLPTYAYSEGGGAKEFVGDSHVYSGWDELESILINKNFCQNNVKLNSWKECARSYFELSSGIMPK